MRSKNASVTMRVRFRPFNEVREGPLTKARQAATGRKPTVRLAHRAKRAIQIRINRRAMQWWALSWVEKGAENVT